MKLALQLVGLFCLGSAAIHLVTGFRTEFAFSMIGVAVCAIGVGYIDYRQRRDHSSRLARRLTVEWQRQVDEVLDQAARGVISKDEFRRRWMELR